MARVELVDAGCFISQMNELLLIDPLYINYAMTNYFNNFINDKKALLPTESLNGIYFPNAKAGLWSSFAIRENSMFSINTQEMGKNMNNAGGDKNYNNEMVLSFICFNNTDFMHEYITIEKINQLKWEIFESNKNHVGTHLNREMNYHMEKDYHDTVEEAQMGKTREGGAPIGEAATGRTPTRDTSSGEPVPLQNYFTNILTVESGQVGLFCIESIKHSSHMLLQKHGSCAFTNKEQLDDILKQNINDLYPWYDKICNLTLSSSIAVIDFIDMPVGSVCMSSADCVVNYLCEVVRDEITDEIWAIRVNFLNALK
ncbi:conserved Plasmodium protein, unknown function [Plasmodium ovale wallikeri]|uniref:Uncharacterized protein n=2 Tax=Plasmodium ovale TaxID=36330 RepID=A0A1A8YS95_PLAOA|nr:conserved Plasmodium protein, unknown function [Plasmodium ovale wallikeri]SBT34757.1 conserved Plasmodium protein, unknown function [Plasmodium ovale wallikeri]SBT76771.1 conserved Plasmodium protein, unknown function [Plasmodium ovale]